MRIGLDDGAPPGLESIMHVEIDQRTDLEFLETLREEITGALGDVRAAVGDWEPMRRQTTDIFGQLASAPSPAGAGDPEEVIEFLRWVAADHFVFLGYRCYDLVSDDEGDALVPVAASGLGILRRGSTVRRKAAHLSGKAAELAQEPELLVLTKANSRSTVHRPIYLDYIGIKRFDATGRVIGEHQILGLYTDRAYNSHPSRIPIVRRRVEAVMERSGMRPPSHDGKALLHLLETLPRAELFQSTEDELLSMARAVLSIEERRRVRLLIRADRYERFFSCLVFVPRERYNTELRERIQKILLTGLDGRELQFSLTLSESVLARVHFVVRVADRCPPVDVVGLEAEIAQVAADWRDDLRGALEEQMGEERGTELWPCYRNAFPAGYRADVAPGAAVWDIRQIEQLHDGGDVGVAVYRRPGENPCEIRIKLYHKGHPLPLTDFMPILENVGVRVLGERPYEVHPEGQPTVYVHDFHTRHSGPESLEIAALQPRLQEALSEIWAGRVENDGFNRLLVRAGLDARQITYLRALCRYLLQARVGFSQAYMERTLGGNPPIAAALVELLETRFDPEANDREPRAVVIRTNIETALEGVPSLDEDRILRAFLAVVDALLRTNAYQTDDHGEPHEYLSLKIDSALVPFLPVPRPQFEIFVYAPGFEGVHLRAGAVARGGIRWSDRLEDFRTEVLGLMKAQVVKNAVIVPVGAKGGFVIKPGEEDAPTPTREDAKHCYRSFIGGLLDITDNIVDGEIVPPAEVVRYDDDDPYLVVAADKGTATFSDLANSVAEERGFWLGDGFASGGSVGYDHKQMGITARGAWESVKRHFRSLDIDAERDAITAVGIGDMSGDVFGNGLLLSETIELRAAFNHLHIFVDPKPNAATTYTERRRLFALGRGSWDQYDPSLISAGGGVFERSAKSISTTPQMRKALGFEDERLTPAELVNRILKARVDLLWNGGIGTFVKASTEEHADADDRSNDSLRVDADQLRCKVIAEGGNLGMTQRARIEFAAAGGSINTDFIDNSGGVDTSDHEVNLKILLNAEVARGALTTVERNELLEKLESRVAESVLLDNYRQALAISVAEARGAALLEAHGRAIRALERSGRIDRELEGLPSDQELIERKAAGRGLTRPELAVLLAWTKIDVKSRLFESEVLDDPHFAREISSYFGDDLATRFADGVSSHRLRRNIVATKVTNSLVNRAGPRFVHQITEVTGAEADEVVRAFVVAREVFGLRQLWIDVEALDTTSPARTQIAILLDSVLLSERSTRWFLRHCPDHVDVSECVDQFGPAVEGALSDLLDALPAADASRIGRRERQLLDHGVPEETARRAALLLPAFATLDIADVSRILDCPLERTTSAYFKAGERLGLRSLHQAVAAAPVHNHWHELARIAAGDEIGQIQRAVTFGMLTASPDAEATAAVRSWIADRKGTVAQLRRMLGEIRAAAATDWAMVGVALREARQLANAG
ncbi:MAG: NAD-glutamate dehydrogenase [Acidobacteriota bacterium]|nr:NAD-glutamate dehydrogenase [Acidobacteriota bacterium]